MSNGTHLLLLQPWLSAEGHPAQSTLCITKVLSRYIPLEVMTFRVQSGDHTDKVLDELRNYALVQDFISNEPIDSFDSIAQGTERLLVEAIDRARRLKGSCSAIYLDASLWPLARSSFLRSLGSFFRLGLIHLYGPESIRQASPDVPVWRQVAKRVILQRFFSRNNVIVGLRTDELTEAWRSYGLVAKNQCRTIPNLEVASLLDYRPKRPHLTNPSPTVFSIVGQIRETKNVRKLVELFLRDKNLGFLHISGFLRMKDFPFEKVKSANERILLQSGMLSQDELLKAVGKSHYTLLLYTDMDDRMESSMLYTAAVMGVPVIASNRGWLARMVRTHRLGYLVDPDDSQSILECLRKVAPVESHEYNDLQRNIGKFIQSLRAEIIVPEFLTAFDYI